MYNGTNEDGICGYRAVWQASQWNLLPIIDRIGAQVDISYAGNNWRLERIRWMEDLVADLPTPNKPGKAIYLYPEVTNVWCKPANLGCSRPVPSGRAEQDVDSYVEWYGSHTITNGNLWDEGRPVEHKAVFVLISHSLYLELDRFKVFNLLKIKKASDHIGFPARQFTCFHRVTWMSIGYGHAFGT